MQQLTNRERKYVRRRYRPYSSSGARCK